MKVDTMRSVLSLALILVLMLLCAGIVNAATAPVIAAREKALLGDAVDITAELSLSGTSVQSVLRDEAKQLYTLKLSTSEGYSKGPIELTLTVDFSGKIAGLELVSSADDKDFGEAFLPSFTGQDSALAGVELVAGVTYSTSAIRNAVAEGMNTLADNGLITAGEKSAEQILTELIAQVYPDLANAGGAVQGERVEGSGRVSYGYMAPNGSAFAWFAADNGADYLGVWTPEAGVQLYGTDGQSADNASLAEEIAALSEAQVKALRGDAVEITEELTVTAETVQAVYRDDTKQLYTLILSTTQGYTGEPIELTLSVDFEGRIAELRLDRSGETKELSEDFLPSFAGQDSALADVELVAGVTFSSSAIKGAVSDGMETLIENGLIAAGEKSAEQQLIELIPSVFPGLVNKAGAIQGEELEGSGSALKGYAANNGSGYAWLLQGDLLGVYTPVGGAMLYDTEGQSVQDEALLAEIEALSLSTQLDLFTEKDLSKAEKSLKKLLPDDAELEPIAIPGLANSVAAAYRVKTEEGLRYAFVARPYGYSNEIMELYFVLDENGAIAAWRVKELILHSDYFSNYTLDEAAYKEAVIGLTGESYEGEQALIAGATMSSDAVDTALRDVFEAFRLITAE